MKHRVESIRIIADNATDCFSNIQVVLKCYDGYSICTDLSYKEYLNAKSILELNSANIYIT